MNLGILMSLFNQRYFRDALSTFCEFIPQMIFLNALFGYLCFLILLKCAHTRSIASPAAAEQCWPAHLAIRAVCLSQNRAAPHSLHPVRGRDWQRGDCTVRLWECFCDRWVTGSTADLYHIMIYMFLNPLDCDCGGTCPENVLFPGQCVLQVRFVSLPLPKRRSTCSVLVLPVACAVLVCIVAAVLRHAVLCTHTSHPALFVQPLLLIAALVAVPWMLIPKPYYLRKRHLERHQHGVRFSGCSVHHPLVAGLGITSIVMFRAQNP